MDFTLDPSQLSALILSYAPKVIGALLVIVIGFWLANKIAKLVAKSLKKSDTDKTIIPFVKSLVGVGIKVLVLLSAAGMFGIETTSFIAIFSALAFAVGMALQGSLGHFASGVLLLTFRPYKVGDLVTIGGGQTGVVESIQIFNTVLATLDNHRLIVPNGTVTSNVIANISGQGTVGVPLSYGIGYGDDIDQAKKVILEVIDNCPYLLKDPTPGVVVSEHGDSAVMLATRPFCKSEDYWPAFFYMQEQVKKEFDKAGISIPFPQQDVHMHQVAAN